EEVEPGVGWYYTDWLTALSKNTSIPTPELGKLLIDTYTMVSAKQAKGSATTLSLMDLAELSGTVPKAFTDFAGSMSDMIDHDGYETVSNARTGSREFSSGINQVDLIHFAKNLNTSEAKALVKALEGCIKYNRTAGIDNANGVSIYFPHNSIAKVGNALNTYEKFGMDEEYTDCIRSFASMTVGGQATSFGGGDLLGTLLQAGAGMLTEGSTSGGGLDAGSLLDVFLSGGSTITSGSGGSGLGDLLEVGDIASWLDMGRVRASKDYFAENRFDPSALVITEKNGQKVIALSEAQWSDVRFMEQSVFLDDGEGFIDLGLDNVYEYNDDGDLVMDYDGTWLALNGQIVSYYMETDDHAGESYRITGYVPAYLNGRQVEIVLCFTDTVPEGSVLGARLVYDSNAETDTAAKGLIEIKAGDKIDYLCDYYAYDGTYSDSYYLGEQFTATGSWTINNAPVGDMPYSMTYRFTDIYGNRYWAEAVTNKPLA
ncbi:MAG: peptidase C11, partial [Eubacteriales bacterium]|nr:peptidase C11 [Eubacteriales bacterium]